MINKDLKVTLIDHTSDAVEKLIFTKSTRLEMSPNLLQEIKDKSEEEKMEALEYMSRTIPSSWEFVNYTFMIENVTRGFTHQFVRTRQGSYAQQTMRVLEMANFSYHIPDGIYSVPGAFETYKAVMKEIQSGYDRMIGLGCKPEDARGVLPTNIHTNICAQFNLRTLSEMAKSRTGTRTQDEYRCVFNCMVDCVLTAHPWAEKFLFPKGRSAFTNLEKLIKRQEKDSCGVSPEFINDCKKDLDLLRKG